MEAEQPEAGTVAACRCGAYTVLPASRRLLRDGQQVELEAKVFDLILLLIGHHTRAVQKQEIVDALWGRRPITDAALSQLVYKARRAFDDDGERQAVIRTVYGRGFQWIAPIEPLPEDQAPSPASGDPATPGATTHTAIPTRRVRRWWLGAAALVALVVVSLWLIPRAAEPAVTPLPRLALLPVVNATGNPAMDWAGRGLPGLIAGLLDGTRGIDVIDPLQVARIWNFKPPRGRSQAEHTRLVSGAQIVVAGQLRRVADHLYQLTLHVDPGAGGQPTDLSVTGSDAGALGMAAVPRLRRALRLDDSRPAVPGAAPHDAYLAQTYARGIDAAMHGDWSGAKPYFLLVARGEPGFLPARLRLGQAQVSSDELAKGETTLRSLLAQARKRDDPAMIGQALLQLANVAFVQHRHAQALDDLSQATPFAERSGEADLQAAIALKATDAAARLKRPQLAEQHWRNARDIIQRSGLHRLDADLHNSEAFLALARGDLPAKERADRAALAASEAIGNEHNALGDTYNLALDLVQQDRAIEALPLFASLYQRARKSDDSWLAFASGDQQAIALLNAGVSERVRPLADQLLAMGVAQHNPAWQTFALMLRSGQQWYDGDPRGALASCRAAARLVDGAQDPALLLAILESQAAAALLAEPTTVADLAAQADALAAAKNAPAGFGYVSELIHALAATADRQPARAVAALRKAAALPAPDDPAHNDLHYIGLLVALTTGKPEGAQVALADFDPGHSNNADALRLYAQWSDKQGDAAGRARATARLAQLRSAALKGLDGNHR